MCRAPYLYPRYRRLLAEQEGWDESAREAWTAARLTTVLRRAGRLSAYRAQASMRLQDWPVLAKAQIAGCESDFLNRLAVPWRSASSGGVTGHPLALRRSLSSMVFEQASMDHLCAGLGLNLPRARIAMLRADRVKPLAERTPPFWRRPHPRRLLLSAFHLAPETIRAYAAALRLYAPDVLICYPSTLGHLLTLLAAANEQVCIPFVLASSEALSASVIAQARRALQATVIDYYGQAERAAASFSVNGAPHRMLPLYGVPELGARSFDGHELIATPLWNQAQIFIRYRTGDTLRMLDAGRSAMGPMPHAARFFIEGRVADAIDLQDGRIVAGLSQLPRDVPGIVTLQLRQCAAREIELLIVRAADYGPASEDAIRANYRQIFPEDVAMRIVPVAAPIRLTSGAAPLLLR